MISNDQAKTSGGAYIVRAFAMDQKDFVLQSSLANQVDALLWYPSGKVYARFKQGNIQFLGRGNPVLTHLKSQTLNFYIPQNSRLRIKQSVHAESVKEVGIQARSVTQKAILTNPGGEDLFFESSQLQIFGDDGWVTP